MSELVQYQGAALAFSGGSCMAKCNHPSTTMSVDEIKAMRAEPIDKNVFTDCMALYHERFDKEPKPNLLRYYLAEYSGCMGHNEFLAAFRDLMAEDLYFAAGWAYIFKHVEKQRKDGPDLGALSFSEVYRRGRGDADE